MVNINSEIERVCSLIAQVYRDTLKSQDAVASGELVNFKQTCSFDGRWFEVTFLLPDYWKYIENGTKPHWPPVDAIKKWIQIKPVVPRAYNGKVPTTEQLAFLIGRKIAEDGTKPRHSLQKALDASESLIEQLEDLIVEQLETKINDDIENVLS